MARTIIYASQQPLHPTLAGNDESAVVDDYSGRLQKYVPAEVLSFFLLATALPGVTDTLRWVFLMVGACGTPLYLYTRAPNTPRGKRPRGYFYALAIIAFFAWAIGTSRPTAQLFDLAAVSGPAILVCTAFLMPGIDYFVDTQLDRRRRSKSPQTIR